MGKAIVDHIPVGRENAVTRRQLCELTGMRDRALRNAIEDARQNGEIIINAQDGRGYYRSEEPNDLAGQYVRNRNRAMAILVQQKYIRRKLKAAGWEFVKGRNPVQGNTVVWPKEDIRSSQGQNAVGSEQWTR